MVAACILWMWSSFRNRFDFNTTHFLWALPLAIAVLSGYNYNTSLKIELSNLLTLYPMQMTLEKNLPVKGLNQKSMCMLLCCIVGGGWLFYFPTLEDLYRWKGYHRHIFCFSTERMSPSPAPERVEGVLQRSRHFLPGLLFPRMWWSRLASYVAVQI